LLLQKIYCATGTPACERGLPRWNIKTICQAREQFHLESALRFRWNSLGRCYSYTELIA
jgi:hypothetical protein